MAAQRQGFASHLNRQAKAKKIQTILEQALGRSLDGLRVLDVGTGTGEIAAHLGQRCQVISVDPNDHREVCTGYHYVRAGTLLPFHDGAFDVVISNHVIEHLPDPVRHLAEMARVLSPDGVGYLATPNRLWPQEVHHRVWLLHWLPRPAFEAALRFIGRYREPLWLLGWRTLRHLTSKEFVIQSWTEQVTRFPARYHMAVPRWIAACLAVAPRWVHRVAMPLSPTFVVTLRPGSPLEIPGRKSSICGEHSGSFGVERTTDKAARSLISRNFWPSLNSKQAEVHASFK